MESGGNCGVDVNGRNRFWSQQNTNENVNEKESDKTIFPDFICDILLIHYLIE